MIVAASQAAHVVVDQVARALAVQDSGWAIFAAIAAATAALGTFTLAFFTWQSVTKTNDIIENENANYRATTTIALLQRYTDTLVQGAEEISLTPFTAASQIEWYAKRPKELASLQAQCQLGTCPDFVTKEYRSLSASFPVVLNYYMIAILLLREESLNTRLFMNAFAKSFVSTLDAMLKVNAVVNMVPSASIERRNDLRQMCEKWLKGKASDNL